MLVSMKDPVQYFVGINLMVFHCWEQLIIAADYAVKLISH